MKNIAMTLVDLYFQLNFVEEDYVEFDWGSARCADILQAITHEFSSEERESVMAAAQEKLAWILREPDKDGYTPRKLVKPEMKEFLEAVAAGRFDGSPADT